MTPDFANLTGRNVLYAVVVFGQETDVGNEALVTLAGGPGPLWDRIPDDQEPVVARAVAAHLSDFAAHLTSTADLVDDIESVDDDAVIAEHNRTRNEGT